MKIKKIYMVSLIVLLIFTIGIVSAEDNTTDLQSPIEPTHDIEVVGKSEDTDIEEHTITNDNNQEIENDSRYEIGVTIYSLNPIYPWSWIDSDGDSGPGIDIWVYNPHSEYEPTGNTTIYYNGELVDTIQGIKSYLIHENHIWDKYTGNGEYYVNVVYSGDEHFKPLNITKSYSVYAYTCELNYHTVFVTLPIWESGTLTVKANEKTYTKKVYGQWDFGPHGSQSCTIGLKELKIGENTVEVKFKSEDSNIPLFTEYFNISYYPNKCPIEVFVMDSDEYYYSSEDFSGEYYYGEDNLIIFSVPKDITNKVNVEIDGKSCNYTKIIGDMSDYGNPDYDSAYEIDIHDLTIGNHTVCVSYPGDSKYTSNCQNRTLKVFAKIKYDGDCIMSLCLPDDAVGNFTVKIKNGDEYHLFDTVAPNGQKAVIQLPCGSYDLIAYYTGSDYEIESLDFFELVFPCPDEMNYGQSKILKIPNNANTRVVLCIGSKENELVIAEYSNLNNNTILINKELIDMALKTDMAKRLIKQNYAEKGSYFLDLNPLIYTDNGNYTLHPIRVNFASKITGAKDITMQYSDSKYMNLKIYDIYGKLAGKDQKVTIAIGKKTFSAKTDKNGAVKFKIPNTVTPGKYAVKITYKTAKVTKKLTVKQILSLKTVKVKKSAKKLVLTATLTKVKGKVLKNKAMTFKFNGKTYKAKTNSKGVAKVTVKSNVLKKLKVGKKVTYQATYIKDTVKKTAKVQK